MIKMDANPRFRIVRFLIIAASVTFSYCENLATNFDVQLATPPPLQQYQFQLQAEVEVLMSAGNVYYDANLDNIPRQAYEITDEFGNPLGPYLMTNPDFENYVLDVTPLLSGIGLHPFHRGLELINASQRAWRLDYYKAGVAGGVYTTVMSGPISDLGGGVYELNVDLGLRWSEEGDNLNRLNQGRFSHIALAIGDFRKLTLSIDPLLAGAANLRANVFTDSPTAAPTVSPTAPPSSTVTAAPSTPVPSNAPTSIPTGDQNRVTGTSTTEEPVGSGLDRVDDGDEGKGGKKGKSSEDDAQDRVDGDSGKKGKKGDGDSALDRVDGNCASFGKKGKCKKGKGKKGKMSLESIGLNPVQGGAVAGVTAFLFIMSGWALVAYRHKQAAQAGYEPVAFNARDPPLPIVPTTFAVFGTFSPEEIKKQAQLMRVPPSMSISPEETTSIN